MASSVQVDIDYAVFQAALNRATAEGKTIGQIIAEFLAQYTEGVTTGSLTTYTVQHGDTLAKIALKFYGDAHKYPLIQRANNIVDSGRIWVGQVLIIPPVADATPTASPLAPPSSVYVPKRARPDEELPSPLPAESPKPIMPRSQRRSNLHPNDVQLVRVYPREKGGRILEETLPSDAEFEVVVEAKAGVTIHGCGGKYLIQIVVRDLTDFTVVHKDNLEGKLAYEPWDEPVLSHAFPIPAQGPVKEYHIYEVLASLCVGIRNPNVSFAKSPMFIICEA